MELQTLFIYSLYLVVMCVCGSITAKAQYVYSPKVGYFHTKYPNKLTIVMFLFFAVLAGLRYDVGTDHLIYLNAYLSGGNNRFEYIFNIILTTFNQLGFHPTVFFGALALLQVSFFFSAFKDERYLFPYLAVFLFANGLFGSWMNTIRQDIAICIWLFGSRYIFEKKIYKYLLFCALAYGFHRSSILFVLLYPLFRNGKDIIKSVPIQLTIYLTSFVLSYYMMNLIMMLDNLMGNFSSILMLGDTSKDYYSTYTVEGSIDQMAESARTVVQTGLAIIFKYFCYGLIILYSKKMKAFYNSKSFDVYYFFFFFALILKVLMPNGAFNLMRPFQFTTPFLSIMLAYFVYYLLHNRSVSDIKTTKTIGTVVLVGFIGIMFLSIVTSSSGGYKLFFINSFTTVPLKWTNRSLK